MEINRSNIIEICQSNSIKPDKDYGQNFLVVPEVAKKIVDLLHIREQEKILEIGPGLGSLTHFLSEYDNEIDVVDIDYNMVGFLSINYKEKENVNVILSDIRNHDISCYNKIIANLPYNITTEVITYLLLNSVNTKKMVLMCQNEAFNHFFDIEGSEYGPASVLTHLLTKINKGFLVGRNSFYPAPKVESMVFTMEFLGVDPEPAKQVYKLAKSLFLNRRKTILNNLSRHLGDKEKAQEVLSKAHIPLNYRPEQIKPDQYLLIYNLIK